MLVIDHSQFIASLLIQFSLFFLKEKQEMRLVFISVYLIISFIFFLRI